jgi:hypothetical protein
MVGVGNCHIERIADDVDGSGSDGKVDRRMAGVNGQRLVSFDEDQTFDEVGEMLLDAGARRRDLVEMFIRCRETENFVKQKLGGACHGELIELIDPLGLRFSRRDVHKLCRHVRVQVFPDFGKEASHTIPDRAGSAAEWPDVFCGFCAAPKAISEFPGIRKDLDCSRMCRFGHTEEL